MNHNASTFSAYLSALMTTVISLFRPEEWMVIGIIVGIVATIITTAVNAVFRAKLYRLQHKFYDRHDDENPPGGAL
ncbi:phage holin family protein [Edwardsiella tarda]|uniref:phage holin n=1 Tax=Edwardsiella tarda TaxID=636 RepID=UPI00285655BF|nr:hypothetical protein [Escherichia coli]